MRMFYLALRQNQVTVAEALRRAQTSLRDATNDELHALAPDAVAPPADLSPLGHRFWGRAPARWT
jgi:CHAT domain-containing protein